MEQSSVLVGRRRRRAGENTYKKKKIQFGYLKRPHLLSEEKRSLIASGSAAAAGILNKRCHTVALLCRFMSAEASELLHAVRRGCSTAGHGYAEGSEELPSEVLLHYPFFPSSAAG